jgi:hypothetical protein
MWRGVEGPGNHQPMEPMTVRVQAITVRADVVTAVVTSISRERCKGLPVVRIQISLRLPVPDGECPRHTRERVRDEALRFLDVA